MTYALRHKRIFGRLHWYVQDTRRPLLDIVLTNRGNVYTRHISEAERARDRLNEQFKPTKAT